MRAVFVTGNEHKRREVEEILGFALEAADLDVPEIQAIDPAEVAAEKARAARELLGSPGVPVIAEDSGIAVGAWNDFPGALTKWLMNSVGNEGFLKMLAGFDDRSAWAVCVAAVATPDGSVEIFRGEVSGKVATEPRGGASPFGRVFFCGGLGGVMGGPVPRGGGGFGYDPVFVPGWSSLTYAEMGEEKSRDSHRARAFRQVRGWLEGA